MQASGTRARRHAFLVVAAALLAVFSVAAVASEQVSGDPWGGKPFSGIDRDELRVSLAPRELAELEAYLEPAMADLRELTTALAALMIERMRLERVAEPDMGAIARADEQIAGKMAAKRELVGRVNVLLDAIEVKGGDPAAARGYIAAIALLDSDVAPQTVPPDEIDPEEAVRDRANELIAIVRAEPSVHDRADPWEVPVSELELELQPLPLEEVLARLEKWREMLQREVRKRIRIDILLSDAMKLEQVQEQRREAAGPFRRPGPEIVPDDLKHRLAELSQRQQLIVNAIVARMEVAVRLVERRGGDASSYTRYIAAATGQKLNLTDPTILRAQVLAWLRSRDGGVKIGLNILKFTGIVLVFWLLGRLLGNLTSTALKWAPSSSSLLRPILASGVRRITLFVGFVVGVSALGVSVGPVLAMIGAAGLILGLALQGTLGNFASGLLILLTRPFDVGDIVEAGGVLGKVEAMSLVSTRILTFDNQLHLVPNNEVWGGVITNVTGKVTRRVDLTFGIGYGDDMDRAMEIIREVITAHDKVHADPAPVIKVAELGDNSVNIIARPWTRTEDYWDVYWDLTREIKARFDAEGINIPFPQRDVHLPGPIEIKLSRATS